MLAAPLYPVRPGGPSFTRARPLVFLLPGFYVSPRTPPSGSRCEGRCGPGDVHAFPVRRVFGAWGLSDCQTGHRARETCGMSTAGYTCSNCHEWFEYEDGWTDEDALAEARANGFNTAEEMCVVCDDCYRGMGLLQAMLPPGALAAGVSSDRETRQENL